MKKNGFISISLVFSFMLIFLLLLAMMLQGFANNRVKLGLYKQTIKENDYDLYHGEGS